MLLHIPTQQTGQRPGEVSVLPGCIPAPPLKSGAGPGIQEDHSLKGLWYHKGDDVSQFGCGMKCCFWSPLSWWCCHHSCRWDGGRFKDGEAPPPQRAHSTMSKKSGRGTVDQESASAGAMGLGTGRHGQQQIVDKAYVTEVYRSACHCGHE